MGSKLKILKTINTSVRTTCYSHSLHKLWLSDASLYLNYLSRQVSLSRYISYIYSFHRSFISQVWLFGNSLSSSFRLFLKSIGIFQLKSIEIFSQSILQMKYIGLCKGCFQNPCIIYSLSRDTIKTYTRKTNLLYWTFLQRLKQLA